MNDNGLDCARLCDSIISMMLDCAGKVEDAATARYDEYRAFLPSDRYPLSRADIFSMNRLSIVGRVVAHCKDSISLEIRNARINAGDFKAYESMILSLQYVERVSTECLDRLGYDHGRNSIMIGHVGKMISDAVEKSASSAHVKDITL